MTTPLRLCLTILMLLPVNSYGMWAGISDTQLVKQSDLIVHATYVGSSNITINSKAVRLGVLRVESTLKGKQQEVAFILLSSLIKGVPQRSDQIKFQSGQKGLWFLEKTIDDTRLYEIRLPQRFIPEQQIENRLPALRKLLN